MTEHRIITSAAQLDDEALEASIRPKRLSEYLGQQAVREQLSIYIEAAKKTRRRSRSCADLRAAGPGQDHVEPCHRQ